MMVVITSCAPVRALRKPGMKPHSAPVSVPIATASISSSGLGTSRKASTATVAPMAPMMNWPSTPMLKTPLRKEIATASPVKMSGADATSVSVIGRIAPAITFGLLLLNAAASLDGTPKAPMTRAEYALPMFARPARTVPSGSPGKCFRFSMSVMNRNTDPTRNAVKTASTGTSAG